MKIWCWPVQLPSLPAQSLVPLDVLVQQWLLSPVPGRSWVFQLWHQCGVVPWDPAPGRQGWRHRAELCSGLLAAAPGSKFWGLYWTTSFKIWLINCSLSLSPQNAFPVKAVVALPTDVSISNLACQYLLWNTSDYPGGKADPMSWESLSMWLLPQLLWTDFCSAGHVAVLWLQSSF